MKIAITDFRFQFHSAGHYIVYYTNFRTRKSWSKLITDMTIIDEYKDTETNDHTQVKLNYLKKLIKKTY